MQSLASMQSLYEEMGGTYRQSGDYLIPELELPKTANYTIGKYGRMHHQYLKEQHPTLYSVMVLNGTLYLHLAETDRICKERLETIIAGMKQRQGITEELKSRDPLAWVGAMNNIQNAAEEIICSEVIYV